MNLEEELNILESKSVMMQQPTENQIVTDGSQSIPMNNFNTNMNVNMSAAPMMDMAQPQYQQPIQNQPAMVNTNMAAQQAAGFNYANLEFDINKPLFEKNPLERLTGDKGVTFRVHMLPNASPSQVHVHWDAEKGHNIVCLKDAYGTPGEPCCGTHGDPKTRIVIPVLLYPTVQGNPNMLIPGQKAELRSLVLGYKSFQDLQNQANLAGVILTQGDIFATVDNPTYKSFNFTVRQDNLLSQVPNVAELEALWKEVGTPENRLKACGKLITREEYNAGGYNTYDYKKHKDNTQTPTQGGPVNSYTFNTPMNGYGQTPFGQQNQPFYNGQQSQTSFNSGNMNNPWQ